MMHSTLLCLALLVPEHQEKDIVERILEEGATVHRLNGATVFVDLSDSPKAASRLLDLGELCELRELKALRLAGTAVTDKNLRTVAVATSLTWLDLDQTAITDDGLRHLQKLTNLRRLRLSGCRNISPEGVVRLKKALPNCTIVE